jgi:FtsP/CotA-like multicopper oxidase with cupredoxin domain
MDCGHLPASDAPAAIANDNRTPAGTLSEGVLTLHLVLQPARWYPEGEQGCGIEVYAFAEEGKTAQTPGPLIRVPVGTELRVTVRSAIAAPMFVWGLKDRSRDSAITAQAVAIAPGATHEFILRGTTPGTFYYFASGLATAVNRFVPANQFSQAVGAFIVDSVGGEPRDRIFVMTRWRGPNNSPARQEGWELTAFNGRSWPHTERISTTVGDTVRWRVIAGNNSGHAMHLHGFYFLVESKGDLVRDSVYAPADRRLMVTEPLGPGVTMTLRWIPERPGNWIFHCHLVVHMSATQRVDHMAGAAPRSGARTEPESHAMHGMAGLVLGISVRPAAGTSAATAAVAPRTLRLFANQRDGVFGDRPGYGFVLQQGVRPPAADSVRIPGTTLVLTRDEPVQITVMNRLKQALAVHWHGIELESYFDGVAGWSGAADRIAPPVAPGDSFAVRFTPPRAGTFIYHVHNETGEELPSGLYGALIVLDPGARFDAETDRLFVISEPGPGNGPLGQVPRSPFVNGSATPEPLELTAGRTYRFRFIGISANNVYEIVLRRSSAVEQWRLVARDGADLPPASSRVEPAQFVGFGTGMTLDYAFTPSGPGDLTLEVDPHGPPAGRPIGQPTRVPIRVRVR